MTPDQMIEALTSPLLKRFVPPKAVPVRHDRLQCIDCGHEQTIESATSALIDGHMHFWFGSAYDHCGKCDGPMKALEIGVPEKLK